MSLEHTPTRASRGHKPKHQYPEGYLTRAQVARWLGVSLMTVHTMVRDGRLEAPILISSRNLRFRPGVLERFEARCEAVEYAGADRDAA